MFVVRAIVAAFMVRVTVLVAVWVDYRRGTEKPEPQVTMWSRVRMAVDMPAVAVDSRLGDLGRHVQAIDPRSCPWSVLPFEAYSGA
jgi:hypothetical protein